MGDFEPLWRAVCTVLYTDLGQGIEDMPLLGHADCVWAVFVQIYASLNMYRARLQSCQRAVWLGQTSLGQLFPVEADVATQRTPRAESSLQIL